MALRQNAHLEIVRSLKPGTHEETFVCNSVLQTKVSWCVRPKNMFQEIFGVL